jgi:hypothetical protein
MVNGPPTPRDVPNPQFLCSILFAGRTVFSLPKMATSAPIMTLAILGSALEGFFFGEP